MSKHEIETDNETVSSDILLCESGKVIDGNKWPHLKDIQTVWKRWCGPSYSNGARSFVIGKQMIEHAEGSNHLRRVKTKIMVNALATLVRMDHSLIVPQLTQMMDVSVGNVQSMLTEDLKMWHVCTVWVLYHLTCEQLQKWIENKCFVRTDCSLIVSSDVKSINMYRYFTNIEMLFDIFSDGNIDTCRYFWISKVLIRKQKYR